MNNRISKLDLEFDRKHLWHPYTTMINPDPVYPVVSVSGVRLKLEDERELIDGTSSWWCAIHGYNVPELNSAITEQLKSMSHVMFGGLTHKPAIDLAKLLVEITPSSLEKVFLCDSGSISVEVAIKMAIQYWFTLGRKAKKKLLTLRGGYHGDTLGTMPLCDPENGMHQLFSPLFNPPFYMDRPLSSEEKSGRNDIESLREQLEGHHEEIAAIILEPIVQNAGGMWFYSPEYLNQLRELADRYEVLVIFDEIATGFGRTGRMFASEHTEIEPDIMCLGKSLTGGYMTLAATLATEKVSQVISDHGKGILMHGPTFMANPLACSVAKASIELLLSTPWQERILSIEKQLYRELSSLQQHPAVFDVRVLGGIGVVELKKSVRMKSMISRFVDSGVWVRPFGKLVYLMPPYIINSKDLTQLTKAVSDGIEAEYSY